MLDVKATWQQAWAEALAEAQQRHPDKSEYRRAGRVTKDKPQAESFEWWEKEGLRQAEAYQKWMATSGWQVAELTPGTPAIELEVSTVFGGVPVKAYLDAVLDAGPFLVIVDYKSGSREQMPVQLGLYGACIQRTVGIEIKHGAYFMTRKGELGAIHDLTHYTPQWFDRLFAGLAKAKEIGLYLPNVGDHCRNLCGVSSYCYAVGGEQSQMFDPDHPQYTYGGVNP